MRQNLLSLGRNFWFAWASKSNEGEISAKLLKKKKCKNILQMNQGWSSSLVSWIAYWMDINGQKSFIRF